MEIQIHLEVDVDKSYYFGLDTGTPVFIAATP